MIEGCLLRIPLPLRLPSVTERRVSEATRVALIPRLNEEDNRLAVVSRGADLLRLAIDPRPFLGRWLSAGGSRGGGQSGGGLQLVGGIASSCLPDTTWCAP